MLGCVRRRESKGEERGRVDRPELGTCHKERYSDGRGTHYGDRSHQALCLWCIGILVLVMPVSTIVAFMHKPACTRSELTDRRSLQQKRDEGAGTLQHSIFQHSSERAAHIPHGQPPFNRVPLSPATLAASTPLPRPQQRAHPLLGRKAQQPGSWQEKRWHWCCRHCCYAFCRCH